MECCPNRIASKTSLPTQNGQRSPCLIINRQTVSGGQSHENNEILISFTPQSLHEMTFGRYTVFYPYAMATARKDCCGLTTCCSSLRELAHYSWMREKRERTRVHCYAGIRNEYWIQAFAGALSQAQQVVMQKDDDWGNGRLFAIGRAAAGTAALRYYIWRVTRGAALSLPFRPCGTRD